MSRHGITFGKVMHARSQPVSHRFAYSIFYLHLDLSQLDDLHCGILRLDRPGLMSFYRQDHGPRDGSDLSIWIKDVLSENGLHCADGRVVLQTFPRILGYVFNPVSFWYCYDQQEQLRVVLAEVNNTFGEHHNYLVFNRDYSPLGGRPSALVKKVFHVSPFFEVDGHYRFSFQNQPNFNRAGIDYYRQGELQLTTSLYGTQYPLTPLRIFKALFRYPMQSLGVMIRIHYQALRLWIKSTPFFSKPIPPTEATTR